MKKNILAFLERALACDEGVDFLKKLWRGRSVYTALRLAVSKKYRDDWESWEFAHIRWFLWHINRDSWRRWCRGEKVDASKVYRILKRRVA